MGRTVAWTRTFQPSTSMAEAWMAFRQGSLLVAVRIPMVGIQVLRAVLRPLHTVALVLPTVPTVAALLVPVLLRR